MKSYQGGDLHISQMERPKLIRRLELENVSLCLELLIGALEVVQHVAWQKS